MFGPTLSPALALASAFLSSSAGRAIALTAGGVLALGVTFGAGFLKGDSFRSKLDDEAGKQAQIELLQRQIAASDAANKDNAARLAADEAALRAQEKLANDAVKATSAGVCVDGADADGVRSLWGKPKSKSH